MSDLFIPRYRPAAARALPAALRRHLDFDVRAVLPRPATDDPGDPGDFHELLLVTQGVHAAVYKDPAVLELARERARLTDGLAELALKGSATARFFIERAVNWRDLVVMRSAYVRANLPDQAELFAHPKTHPLFRGLPLCDPDHAVVRHQVLLADQVARLTVAKLWHPTPADCGKVAGRARALRNIQRSAVHQLANQGLRPPAIMFDTGLPRATMFRLRNEALLRRRESHLLKIS